MQDPHILLDVPVCEGRARLHVDTDKYDFFLVVSSYQLGDDDEIHQTLERWGLEPIPWDEDLGVIAMSPEGLIQWLVPIEAELPEVYVEKYHHLTVEPVAA